jgi:Xaa-Pro aminopeptidase
MFVHTERPSMSHPFETRTRELQKRLGAHEVDAVVCTASPNLYYLTGFWETQMERHLLCFVAASGDPVIVAPDLYGTQLEDETWIDDVRTYGDTENPLALIDDVTVDLDIADGQLLVDPTMWAQFTQDLRSALPGATFDLAEDIMGELRITKDDAELDAIRAASEITDGVVEELRDRGESIVGTTEAELANTIESALLAAGGSELAFDVIVGSGPNGAKPHHSHGDREIRAGDPVVLDFGTRVDHYPSDQTRTLVFGGTPPESFEAASDAVQDAQQAAFEAVEPGIEAGEIDRVARSLIEDRGFGDEFIHRTGHGVGLDVHESPYIAADNDRVLEPRMVFSIEPGVYREGAFGIRIEDLVVVTETGGERLNHTSRNPRTTTER